MMDVNEARALLEQYSPDQIRYITARLGTMSTKANYTVQSGVKLLTAVAEVYLADREASDDEASD